MKGANASFTVWRKLEGALSAVPTPCALLAAGGFLGAAANRAPVFKALNGLRQRYHKGCLSPPQ